MPTEAEIIAKGKSDYFTMRGRYENPYPMNSEEFNHYERGWTQSLKFNGGKLADHASKPAPLPPESIKPPSYNAYADMKGRTEPRKGPGKP